MKRFIVHCMAILTTTTLLAQNIDIGLNGGIGTNTVPHIVYGDNQAISGAKPAGISLVYGLKTMLDTRKWQFGIDISHKELSYYPAMGGTFLPGINSYAFQQRVYISKNAYTIKVCANKKITIGKLETYCGLSAGYVLAADCQDPLALAEKYMGHVNGSGFSVGLQVGGTYFVNRRIGINAEVGSDYTHLTVGAASYKLLVVPATIGFRYRMQCSKK